MSSELALMLLKNLPQETIADILGEESDALGELLRAYYFDEEDFIKSDLVYPAIGEAQYIDPENGVKIYVDEYGYPTRFEIEIGFKEYLLINIE